MTASEIVAAGLYNAAVALMDDDIREELHDKLSPCSDLEFLEAYMEEHEKKYHEPFCI